MKRNFNLKGKTLKFVKAPISRFTNGDVIINIDGKEITYTSQAIIRTLQELLAARFTKLGNAINRLAIIMGRPRITRKRNAKGMFIKDNTL